MVLRTMNLFNASRIVQLNSKTFFSKLYFKVCCFPQNRAEIQIIVNIEFLKVVQKLTSTTAASYPSSGVAEVVRRLHNDPCAI